MGVITGEYGSPPAHYSEKRLLPLHPQIRITFDCLSVLQTVRNLGKPVRRDRRLVPSAVFRRPPTSVKSRIVALATSCFLQFTKLLQHSINCKFNFLFLDFKEEQ